VLHIRLGIQLNSLQLPFRQALAKASELGAAAVEIDARGELKPRELSQTGLRQLRKLLDEYGLRVCAVGFRTRHGYNVTEYADQRVEATQEALAFAYKLGAPVVVNHVGRIPAEPQGPEWELLLTTLQDLGRFGQRTGAMLAARTGAESGQDLARLIDALPEGTLGVDFDPGALIINGFSARDALLSLGRQVVHVHARDGVRDMAQGRGVEMPLGEGAADFPQLLGLLEQQNYRGYFTIEREQARDPMFEISQAVKYLRDL
jgi:sugar phosphate isomerase/epimerase